MNIHEYYYNDNNRRLYVEFSTKEDGDGFYRILELEFSEIEYHSPNIIDEEDLSDLDEDFVIDLINQYSKENELPEQIIL